MKRWFVEDHPAQPHLWEDDRLVADWLDGQLDQDTRSVSQVRTIILFKYYFIGPFQITYIVVSGY